MIYIQKAGFIMTLLSLFSCSAQQLEIAADFEAVKCFSEGYAAVKQNGLWGYINTNGELIVTPQFSEASSVKQSIAMVSLKDGSQQTIRIDKNKFEFTETKSHEEILNFDTKAGEYQASKIKGLYNLSGPDKKKLFPHQFDSIVYIGEDLFIASEYGEGDFLIDTGGRILFHEVLGEIIPELNRERIQYRGDDKSGMIDKAGNILIAKKYWRFQFAGDLVACTEGGKLGLITNTGEKISENIYDEIIPLSDHSFLALITDTGLADIYTDTGIILVHSIFVGDGRIKFGLLPAKGENNLFGYVNAEGKEQIPFSFYYTATFFDNGIAVFGKRNSEDNYSTGLIDTTGRIVLPAEYQQIIFTDDIYTIIKENVFQLLDKNFIPLIDPSKDPVEYLGNNLYAVYKIKTKLIYDDPSIWSGSKGGFVWEKEGKVTSVYDLKGNLIIDRDDYDPGEELPVCSEGLIAAKRKGKWGFIECSD